MPRKGPDCYECKHRRDLSGSAHSACHHPAAEGAHGIPLAEMLAIFASVGGGLPIQANVGLNIKGHEHGIRSGWFNWPFNFDPIWLENCDGFEAKPETA